MLVTCNGFKFFYNLLIHNVRFQEAAECIFSTQAIVLDDPKHSTSNEKRFNLVTNSPSGRILLVGFCKRKNSFETRIISARPASRKERNEYTKKFGNNLVFNALKTQKPIFQVSYLW